MKTRVAVIIPRLVRGGAENMVSQIISNLDLNIFDIKVICIFGDNQNDRLEKAVTKAGIKIYYLNKGLGFSIKAIRDLWKRLDNINPNVINTHLSSCLYAAPWVCFHKVTMLHTIHSMPSYEAKGIRRMIMNLLYRIKKAIPIAISDIIQTQTAELYNLDKGKVETIYNPVDIKRFEVASHTVKNNETITFTNVGRLEKEKNQEGLLKAIAVVFKEHPEIKLNIVGDGPLNDNLKSLTQELGIESIVTFTGFVDNIEDYLALTDIFVLPSLYEGLPLTILEAMASKLPIIASNVGGIPDIVTRNGILINPNNEKELIDAMKKLIENIKLRKEMGELSLKFVQVYNIADIKKKYEQAYLKYAILD